MINDSHSTVLIKIKEWEIPVWVYGNPKNYPIVFVHGYSGGFSEYIGDLPMRYLAKDYCVYAFDLPGFGKSKELSMDRVEFIKLIVDEILDKRKFVLFGLSYGALLSVKYALKYPQNVQAVIIAGMPYFFDIRKIINLSYRVPIVNNFKIVRVIKEFTFLNKTNLSVLKVPVLLLYSKKDNYATARMAEALQRIIPNSRLFLISKYNHGWFLHRIDESGFLGTIEKFLKPFIEKQ